ncbi:endonuclease [Streptomyces chartreusis]|uniref:endonuclease n=1 Tax=Streptomyces chartreusis TaxID=1969 RepID=UPI00386E3FB0|nr:endonuclease [Streptomyces chartreusis]
MSDDRSVVRELVRAHGQTYAEEAGITLRDTPQPLYRLLVLAHLLSARIRGSIAMDTARSLYEYDEMTATQLGEEAELLNERWHGDLRRLRKEADGDVTALRRLLEQFPGVGPAGADIFLREVQRVWPEVAPALDRKALAGARRLGLTQDPGRLIDLAGDTEPAVLAAASVRASLDKEVAEDSLRQAS